MTTDRELLENAATAYFGADNFEWNSCAGHAGCIQYIPAGLRHYVDWNPLTDDGDALRLAVRLKLDVCFYDGFQEVGVQGDFNPEPVEANEKYGTDILAATRRAITCAAAYIGSAKE